MSAATHPAAWTFAACLGQSAATERLVREIDSGRMAHAYMLESAQGTGKLTMAHALAAYALCANRHDGDACGTCRPCRLLAGGNHPDYLELPRETPELLLSRFIERTPAPEPVGDQPLLTFLRLKPVEGKFRVAVIPNAERMRAEAANAFLKTLEEPPGDSLIILTVNYRDRLPATITSRCRRQGLRPLPAEAIAQELEKRGLATEDDARQLAAAAEGSLGDAMRLAGPETLSFWRWLDEHAFANPGAGTAKKLADAMTKFGSASGDNAGKRQNALVALDLVALALRRGLRRDLPPRGVMKGLDALWTAADQVVKNVRPDTVLLSASFEVMAALRNN